MKNIEIGKKKVYAKFGILNGNSYLGHGAIIGMQGIILENYACLNKEDSEQLEHIQKSISSEIFVSEIRDKKNENISTVNTFYFDKKKSEGILFNSLERVEEDETYFAYGHPYIFKGEFEFQRAITLEKEIREITNNSLKILFRGGKLIRMCGERGKIYTDNENVLRDKSALDYVFNFYNKRE